MVSFIDADPAKFKHDIEITWKIRAKASAYLCGSGLKKGKDWVRNDVNFDWFAHNHLCVDTYRLKSEGSFIVSVALEEKESTHKKMSYIGANTKIHFLSNPPTTNDYCKWIKI